MTQKSEGFHWFDVLLGILIGIFLCFNFMFTWATTRRGEIDTQNSKSLRIGMESIQLQWKNMEQRKVVHFISGRMTQIECHQDGGKACSIASHDEYMKYLEKKNNPK